VSSETQDLLHTLPTGARILFIRLRSMGDCLLLTSPLRALKREFPAFRVSVLVENKHGPCFDGNPDVAITLVASGNKLETIRRLRRERFDLIVNLHGGPTSLFYTLAARGRSYGLEGYPYASLYRALLPRAGHGLHTVEGTMAWLHWIGLPECPAPPLYYAPNAEAHAWVRERVGTAPHVLIHPGALFATKRWSAAAFRELGRRLNALGWKVILTAGPGEDEIAQEVARDLKPGLMLLGLTIPQLAELIRGADLYVGNDSGPMHLAAAVGTPVVAVWGSSSATQWHPWQVPQRVVQNPFDCNPCAGYRCHVAPTPLCIESVSVEQVAEAAVSLARETGRMPEREASHRPGIVS
jgi:ADP-heptose:LPS heptosyltransferase